MSALPAQRVEMIPIDRITIVNPRIRNKRTFKEIVDNIAQVGLKKPITVTRLVRSWRGKTHQVTVLESGYEHEERRYSSLTQIAFAITGTRWSGPAFFGLKKRHQIQCDRAAAR